MVLSDSISQNCHPINGFKFSVESILRIFYDVEFDHKVVRRDFFAAKSVTFTLLSLVSFSSIFHIAFRSLTLALFRNSTFGDKLLHTLNFDP